MVSDLPGENCSKVATNLLSRVKKRVPVLATQNRPGDREAAEKKRKGAYLNFTLGKGTKLSDVKPKKIDGARKKKRVLQERGKRSQGQATALGSTEENAKSQRGHSRGSTGGAVP